MHYNYFYINSNKLEIISNMEIICIMNTSDLEKFLAIADTENLQKAADTLNSSPSVLSKSLKRLEEHLAVKLFDRIGKHIQLNDYGRLLIRKAANIVAATKQLESEFSVVNNPHQYKIAGPSILLFRWANALTRYIATQQPHSAIHYKTVYEQEALDKVMNGIIDLALITAELSSQLPKEVHHCQLDTITMQVAAAKNHPLINGIKNPSYSVLMNDILQYPFATTSISPYCGENRGIGCDGWQNHLYPRKLKLVVNDHSVLSQIIGSGQALAYLPDYCVREWNLVPVNVIDCSYSCQEQIILVGYDKNLVNGFKTF